MPNCVYYKEYNSLKMPFFTVNETNCQFCINRLDNLTKEENDYYNHIVLVTLLLNIRILTKNA